MQTLAKTLLRVYCFLVRVVCLLFVLLILWYFIATLTGVINILDLTGVYYRMPQQNGRIALIITGLFMTIFYLPLCSFVKSLFPSISSDKHRNCEKLVILIFYFFIVATSVPILNEKMKISMRPTARESEGQQYVGSMNRAQQDHFAEKSAFATSVDALKLGIRTETTNFKFSVNVNKQAAFHYGVSKDEEVRSYVGGVFLIQVKSNAAKNEIKTERILCVAEKLGTITPLPPTIQNDKLVCGTGTIEVTK